LLGAVEVEDRYGLAGAVGEFVGVGVVDAVPDAPPDALAEAWLAEAWLADAADAAEAEDDCAATASATPF
jgi:hypothetical protein